MVHPGGFEPPTARFVAEYSIQLSYGCIGKYCLLLISCHSSLNDMKGDGASGRMIRLRLTLAGRCIRSVILPGARGFHRLPCRAVNARAMERYGASGRIRTSDRSVRSRVLYPAELRMHREILLTADFVPFISERHEGRWCIREDSNLRPLGS